jgi:double-stranded uracil-DNA glycosylase
MSLIGTPPGDNAERATVRAISAFWTRAEALAFSAAARRLDSTATHCKATTMLPDVLSQNLDVVFVGTAAGKRSAMLGAYYAGRGNRFWQTLYEVGLTRRLYAPHEFRQLPAIGFGFTDLCKTQSGMDREIDQWDRVGFAQRIRAASPHAIAFTSKKAGSIWLGMPTSRIQVGLQPSQADGFPSVFILASPSGAARGSWSIEPWRELAQWLKDFRD